MIPTRTLMGWINYIFFYIKIKEIKNKVEHIGFIFLSEQINVNIKK